MLAALQDRIGLLDYVSQLLKNQMRHYRPRIGITMRIESRTDRFYLSRHYSEAVAGAGGLPLHLSLIPQVDYIQPIVAQLDGILLPGSDSDVDPLRYGQEPHRALGTVQPLKDETDLLVLDVVEKLGLPLLAICFGMQVLNVARGGTLIQDIPSQIPNSVKHEQGTPRDRPSHRVKLAEASVLAKLAGNTEALVNSHHHQAIETIGSNLNATAWAADGLVEALEDPRTDRFAMAVQWHPELGWAKDQLSQSLFKHFVEKAGDFAGNRRAIQNELAELELATQEREGN